MGGDFNYVDQPALDKQSQVPDRTKGSRNVIQEIVNRAGLVDVYRHLNPLGTDTTCFNAANNCSSRIDRFYIDKTLILKGCRIEHTFSTFSDHKVVRLTLKFPKVKGRGYWKCNTRILDDPHFLDDFRHLWATLINSPACETSVDWWDSCKLAFKRLIITHSIRIASGRNDRLRSINTEIDQLQNTNSTLNETLISSLEAEKNALLDSIHEGAKIRAKVNHLDTTDKPLSFFLQTEKKNAADKFIKSLKGPNNQLVDDTPGLINICHNYYSDLLSQKQVDPSLWEDLLKNIPKLNEIDKELCEGPLTFEECSSAIKQMKDSKSPGCDGLPAEFYKKFFPLFGEFLVAVFNNQLTELAPSQRLSFITLLCKNPEKSEDIGNWRPISLLNTDYKIISKALTNRLKQIANTIIGPEQTCGIAGRSIFDNLHFLRNVQDYCSRRKIPGIAVCFDQAKAFDSLDHSYLFKVLGKMGFGPSFIYWVGLLYTDIFSCVLVNGFLTEPFLVSRSVRQGCGLSPLLYALCIQPLANLIKQSLLFKGIPLPTYPLTEARVSMYADDSTVLASDTSSVVTAINHFDTFCRASGAKLNMSKCEACFFYGEPD